MYSQRNRSACVRIPITGNNPKAKRLEFRCPDSSGNPYLALAAMLMAGIGAGDEVIAPALTFIAAVNPIRRARPFHAAPPFH